MAENLYKITVVHRKKLTSSSRRAVNVSGGTFSRMVRDVPKELRPSPPWSVGLDAEYRQQSNKLFAPTKSVVFMYFTPCSAAFGKGTPSLSLVVVEVLPLDFDAMSAFLRPHIRVLHRVVGNVRTFRRGIVPPEISFPESVRSHSSPLHVPAKRNNVIRYLTEESKKYVRIIMIHPSKT